MTSAEIYKLNRQQHQGTFMDRAWRQASTESIEALNDPNLTRKQKFWRGAYTYQGMTTNWSASLKDKQKKVAFLENLLNHKSDFELERD